MRYSFFIILFLIIACSHQRSTKQEGVLTLIQLIDRGGLTETLDTPERLQNFEKIDFLQPQPYKQVTRVYNRDEKGRSTCVICSYHPNGHIWQYLEGKDTRAYGLYTEWFPNGRKKIEAQVIEGPIDLSLAAEKEWVFENMAKVWDEDGNLIAEIPYNKGALEGISTYYYPTGRVEKKIPYQKDKIHGDLCIYNEEDELISKTFYANGVKQGPSIKYWRNECPSFIENYCDDSLQTGVYYDEQGNPFSEIQQGNGIRTLWNEQGEREEIEYQNGFPEGRVSHFNINSILTHYSHHKMGMRHGDEAYFFSPIELDAATDTPVLKLLIHWDNDQIHGTVKTWYENGKLESQSEYYQNKKNGMSCVWYKEGSIQSIEEYEGDLLIKGSYYKLHQKTPISKVEHGNGTATFYDGRGGQFLRKINYVNGKPQE